MLSQLLCLNQFPTVKSMGEGDVGYVVPWAVRVDADNNIFLLGESFTFKEAFDHARVRIQRRGDKILVDRRSTRKHVFDQNTMDNKNVNSKKYLPALLVKRL